MELMVVLAGATLAGIGGYLSAFPEQSRNWVPAREWERNPETAAREQRHLARAVAGALLVVGLCVAIVGAVVL